MRFFGNVTVGTDISLSSLEDAYDAVIVAAGAAEGRRLGIVRDPACLSGTALDFAHWFNGHPHARALPAHRPIRHVCIVGNGNVSLDVARVLARPNDMLQRLGVPLPPLQWHKSLDLKEIRIVGRSVATQTRFSPAELRALAGLDGFRPVVCQADVSLREEKTNECLQVLREWASAPIGTGRPIRFSFGMVPERQTTNSLICRDASDRIHEFDCDLLIEAIGQLPARVAGLAFEPASGAVPHERGLVHGRKATFVAGWSAGRQLNIPLIREEARELSERIVKQIAPAGLRGNSKVDQLVRALPSCVVTWTDLSNAAA